MTYLSHHFEKLIIDNIFFKTKALHVTVQNIRVIAKPPTFTTEEINKVKDVFVDINSQGCYGKFQEMVRERRVGVCW